METTAIIQAVTALVVGTDEHDWPRVKAAFAPQVLLNYTSLAGGQPATLTPNQMLAFL